jgi:hypothetical protein
MSSQALRTTPRPRPQQAPAAAGCTLILPTTAVGVPASAFTLAGFRAWARSEESPPQARLTFLDGEVIIDMSGEELGVHGLVRTAVCGGVHPLVMEDQMGLLYMGGALITNVAANVSNIPDAVLLTYASLDAGRVRAVPGARGPGQLQEFEGIPDWVLEVVSATSVRKDTVLLREAYHRAGIPEYWLIDARREEIDFQILIYRPGGYEAAPQRGGWQRSPLFRRRFRLVREDARSGFRTYTLQVKGAR